MDQPTCPKCHLPVLPVFYFCPNCGRNLRPKPLSISPTKQIGIYFLSIVLPPLGLWPGVKYLLQKDAKAKIVGLIAIILTIVSTIITINLAIAMANSIKEQLVGQFNNQLNSQLDSQLNQQLNNQMQTLPPELLQ